MIMCMSSIVIGLDINMEPAARTALMKKTQVRLLHVLAELLRFGRI